jgi:hypothetical protein
MRRGQGLPLDDVAPVWQAWINMSGGENYYRSPAQHCGDAGAPKNKSL